MGRKIRVLYGGSRISGGFAFVSDQKAKGALCVRWDLGYVCREDFQAEWDCKETKIFFLHANYEKFRHIKAIAAALQYVEKKIGIKGRSIVHPTSRKDITYIKLAKWWAQLEIRKSFLTILLRSAVHNANKRKNFHKVIFQVGDPQGFFKKTPFAVQRFLKGYTKQAKGCETDMWMDTFYRFKDGFDGHGPVSDDIVKDILCKKS